jgi:ankyrin repeat protein
VFMTAASGGRAPVVKLLLSAQADVNHANNVSYLVLILCKMAGESIIF